jgi:long-chain acyl-CoA synthetase
VNSVPELFDLTVRRHPHRPAISERSADGVTRYTYSQLARMAAAAASRLRFAGVAAGDRCAILAENSAAWCAGYLGILQAGAVAVPLDTNDKLEQIRTLLDDSGARLLLYSLRFAETASDVHSHSNVCVLALPTVTCVDATEGDDGERHGLRVADRSPEEPAVILYTSGTTADPKGVVLTHANLLAEKDAVCGVVPVDERDAVLGVLPLCHALAQMANLLLPFSVGAHVVFLDTFTRVELLQVLEEEGITAFACGPQFVYAMHRRVLDHVQRGGRMTRTLFRWLLRTNRFLRRLGIKGGRLLFGRLHRAFGPRMRLLITGGSRFDEAIGRDLYDLGFPLLQVYGLTETSGPATITRPGEPAATAGRPIPGVEVRIETREPEPFIRLEAPTARHVPRASDRMPDKDGEILIRGPIVMKGYWNRPDATAEVLRDGWLHTGDLGRLDSAGRLTITGRIKEIIVLGSDKTIYPEEIEAHYRQSLFIKELCVLGVSTLDTSAAERLHAVVVPDLEVLRDKRIVNTSELIRFELEGLSVSLPSHKRILGFDVLLELLPRTTTGKLKRHEIRRMLRPGARVSRDGFFLARSAASKDDRNEDKPRYVQALVAAVGRYVGEARVVSADSNFELDLGLDSMQRVELLAWLEQRFGMPIPDAIAQASFTVRDLAEAFRGAETAAPVAHEMSWRALLADIPARPQLRGLLVPRRLVGSCLWVIGRATVRVAARPRVEGREHLPTTGPFIISPNHQSYLDPFVLAGLLPYGVFRQTFFVGAAEYFETPLLRWLAAALNVVPVDPDAHLLPAMQAAAFGLSHGRVLVLFPEGERSIDGTVKKFKKGVAILSTHLNVPVVPVAIRGAFDLWPRGRPLALQRLLPWSGHRVIVRFGAPIVPVPGEAYEAQTARLRNAVELMWDGAGRAV